VHDWHFHRRETFNAYNILYETTRDRRTTRVKKVGPEQKNKKVEGSSTFIINGIKIHKLCCTDRFALEISRKRSLVCVITFLE
jgi:hypothetical protein